MDISTAFDHAKHNILLKKLSPYGIRGNNILNMIKDYLSNKYQITTLNKQIICKSKPRKINYGVLEVHHN